MYMTQQLGIKICGLCTVFGHVKLLVSFLNLSYPDVFLRDDLIRSLYVNASAGIDTCIQITGNPWATFYRISHESIISEIFSSIGYIGFSKLANEDKLIKHPVSRNAYFPEYDAGRVFHIKQRRINSLLSAINLTGFSVDLQVHWRARNED